MARIARWSIMLWISSVAISAIPARAGVTREEVERAIRDGVRYLRQAQKPDGSWPGLPGITELATLAMLTAGEPADDPDLTRAIQFIRRHHNIDTNYVDLRKTYTIGLQTMVLAAADPSANRGQIARNAEWLIATQLRRFTPGSWSYGTGRQR